MRYGLSRECKNSHEKPHFVPKALTGNQAVFVRKRYGVGEKGDYFPQTGIETKVMEFGDSLRVIPLPAMPAFPYFDPYPRYHQCVYFVAGVG